MTLDEFIEHLFGIATGFLGWTPQIAWTTPIPEILCAAKARAKYKYGHQDKAEKEKTQAALIMDRMRGLAAKQEAKLNA